VKAPPGFVFLKVQHGRHLFRLNYQDKSGTIKVRVLERNVIGEVSAVEIGFRRYLGVGQLIARDTQNVGIRKTIRLFLLTSMHLAPVSTSVEVQFIGEL
jgi:hypothetical protein